MEPMTPGGVIVPWEIVRVVAMEYPLVNIQKTMENHHV